MPFPVATGGKQVSSKRIEPPTLPPEYDGENTINLVEDGGVAVACYKNILSATLAVSYYDVGNDNMVACLRIQIAPLADGFTGRYRESTFHIMLPSIEGFRKSCLKVIFVHKYIACVISSRVVILQLRKPLDSKNKSCVQLPALPSYISQVEDPETDKSTHSNFLYDSGLAIDKHGQVIIPVASHPRVVPQLEGVTALCDMQTSRKNQNSILLAGLSNGGIVAISYRDVIVAGTLLRLELPEEVLSLCHISMGKRGRLAAVQNSTLSILESHALIGTEEETSGIVSDEEGTENDDDDLYIDESEGRPHRSSQLNSQTEPSDLIRMSLKQTSVVLVNLRLTHSLMHNNETESSLSSAEWIDPDHIALLFCPKIVNDGAINHTIATIFNLEAEPPRLKSVTSLTTTPEKLTEVARGSFLIDSIITGCTANMNYHARSSCLLISSYLLGTEASIVPFVCCWHWSSNTTSLVVVGRFSGLNESGSPYFSYFSAGQGLRKGSNYFVHIIVSSGRFQKNLYMSSTVSPPTSRMKSNTLQFEQPLILSDNSITFPAHHAVINLPRNLELEWRTAMVPTSYISSCGGPPTMASIAPEKCQSVAVASQFGLCMLDACRSHKWKRFDRTEEMQFRVLIMKWWEDYDEEDILVCIIELRDTQQRFLAGWSRRRLDLSHQILEPIGESSISRDVWGISLPPTFTPDSISILTSPLSSLAKDKKLKKSYSTRKAVILVTDTNNNQEPSLLIFQLQTLLMRDRSVETTKKFRDIKIKCSLAFHGGLSPDQKNIFLASASFQFNLTQQQEASHRIQQNETSSENEPQVYENKSPVAIIGIITPQNVLKAAMITKGALLSEATVMTGSISRVHLCSVLKGYYYWTLELTSDRSLWCWAVPPAEQSNAKERFDDAAADKLRFLQLKPPHHLMSSHHDIYGTFSFGTLSCVGDSEMWMLGSSSTTRSQFSVGCTPLSPYGCVMYLGQDGNSDSHELISEVKPDGSTSILVHEYFRVGEVSISTPLFLFPLIHHLLTKQPPSNNHTGFDAWIITRNAFIDFLKSRKHINTTFTGLRLLVLRSVETLAEAARKREKKDNPENEECERTARDFLSRTIALLNAIITPTLFANLLLSVARQLEPSCLKHLFPLPREASKMVTLDDLYLQAVEQGSLATSSSALPLLSTKVSALEECKDIFYHCLCKLTSSNANLVDFDWTRDERHLVRDLFRFATQLELMTDIEFWSDDVKLNSSSIPTAEEKQQPGKEVNGKHPSDGVILTPPKLKRQSTLTSMFNPLFCLRATPLICVGNGKEKCEEKVVYNANGAFIGSGFEEIDYDALEQNSSILERGAKVSVLFLTGKILVRLCLEDGEGGWNRAANLSRLVLGDTAIDESGEGVLKWFQRTPLQTLAVAAYNLSNSIDDLNLTNPDEMTSLVSNFIVQGINAAKMEKLSTSDGSWLLELVILSLSRLSLADSINITSHVAPSLILIAIIVGHTTGRMDDMVGGWKNKDSINPIWMCYEVVKKQLLTV